MQLLDVQLFFTLVHLSYLLNTCTSTNSPPRSPSPVSLEPLRFDDDPSLAFLSNDAIHDLDGNTMNANPVEMNVEQLPERQDIQRSRETLRVDQSSKNERLSRGEKRKSQLSLQGFLPKPKRGRKPYLIKEERKENIRNQARNWKEKKRKEDKDFFARQARRRRKNKIFRQNLGIEIEGKPGKSPKSPFLTKPPQK